MIKSAKCNCVLISNVASYLRAPETLANIGLIILITSPSGIKECGWNNAVQAGLGQLAQSIRVAPEKCISYVLPDEKNSNVVNYVFYSKFLLSLSFQCIN